MQGRIKEISDLYLRQMSYKMPMEELTYGDGKELVQFLHANAHVPETYRKLLEGIGYENYGYVLPHQRPLWPNSDPSDLKHWSLLAKDIIQHMDANNRKGVIGMGHSMGAIASWLAAVDLIGYKNGKFPS